MHVPDENLEEYHRLMTVARDWESSGGRRSGRGDYAGANQSWRRAAEKRDEAQKLRVPGKNGK